jgi:hypothetical protein
MPQGFSRYDLRFVPYFLGALSDHTSNFNTTVLPIVTIGYIDGKVRAKQNKTMEWIKKKHYLEQECLISFAVKRAKGFKGLGKRGKDTEKKSTVIDKTGDKETKEGNQVSQCIGKEDEVSS